MAQNVYEKGCFKRLSHVVLGFLGKLIYRFVVVASILLGSCILLTALLCIVYLLPIKPIDSNVAASAKTFSIEGPYPKLFSWWTSQLDNSTDALMMLVASCDTDESIIVKTLSSHLGGIDYEDPAIVIQKHYLGGQEYNRIGKYSRYWHGYLLFLKPLLMLTNYWGIRILNSVIQFSIVLLVCYLMRKQGLIVYIPAFIISYLMLMPVMLALSLQFSSCFYISIIGTLLLLMQDDKTISQYCYILFLCLGILTAFFDLLTYPITTFGIPALFYLALTDFKESTRKQLCSVLTNLICWCFGYGGIWSLKWIIAGIFTDFNVLSDAIDAFKLRASGIATEADPNVSRFAGELLNYIAFLKTPVTVFAIILLFVYVSSLLSNLERGSINSIKRMIPYCGVAIVPALWYSFAAEHSCVHYWFTNKSCVVSLLAIYFAIISCMKEKNVLFVRKNDVAKND